MKYSPSASVLQVQWLTPLKIQSLCVCWQKTPQHGRFNSNTWHKIFWQNELNITSNAVERQSSRPTEQFYQTPNSDVLLLWQNQNYFCLTEFLWSRWKHFGYCYLSSSQRCSTYSIMARLCFLARNCKIYCCPVSQNLKLFWWIHNFLLEFEKNLHASYLFRSSLPYHRSRYLKPSLFIKANFPPSPLHF